MAGQSTKTGRGITHPKGRPLGSGGCCRSKAEAWGKPVCAWAGGLHFPPLISNIPAHVLGHTPLVGAQHKSMLCQLSNGRINFRRGERHVHSNFAASCRVKTKLLLLVLRFSNVGTQLRRVCQKAQHIGWRSETISVYSRTSYRPPRRGYGYREQHRRCLFVL